MKEIFKVGGILFLVTVIAATSLAAVYSVTKPRILKSKAEEFKAGLTIVLPGADNKAIFPVEKDDQILYYKGFSTPDSSHLVGYAFLGHAAGYSSVIEVLVGVDTTGHVIGIKVLSQSETPGLGTKIQEVKYGETQNWVQKQFIGKAAQNSAVIKDGGEIEAITGATISSRAVARSVAQGYRRIFGTDLNSNNQNTILR
jgi:Na+-translocating ferredoxin:NAD+ oxidoreductase subunit G